MVEMRATLHPAMDRGTTTEDSKVHGIDDAFVDTRMGGVLNGS